MPFSPSQELLLPSLETAIIEEFSFAFFRIEAPKLRELVLGRDFGGKKENAQWNASFYGTQRFARDHPNMMHMGRFVLEFLQHHAASLESLKLLSPLPDQDPLSVVYVNKPIHFPRLRELVTTSEGPFNWSVEGTLESLEILRPVVAYHGVVRCGNDSNSARCLTITAEHFVDIYTTTLQPIFDAVEVLTVKIISDTFPLCAKHIITFLRAFAASPSTILPCLKSLIFLFEGRALLLGTLNWPNFIESIYLPEEGHKRKVNLSKLDFDPSRWEEVYVPSESGYGSDPAEYTSDSEKWDVSEREDDEDGDVEDEDEDDGGSEDCGCCKDVEEARNFNRGGLSENNEGDYRDPLDGDLLFSEGDPYQELGQPDDRDEDDMEFDNSASGNNADHSETSVHSVSSKRPPRPQPGETFDEAFQMFVQGLEELIHPLQLEKRDSNSLKGITINFVRGKQCEEDLDIPDRIRGMIQLDGRYQRV